MATINIEVAREEKNWLEYLTDLFRVPLYVFVSKYPYLTA